MTEKNRKANRRKQELGILIAMQLTEKCREGENKTKTKQNLQHSKQSTDYKYSK